jgi:hypothetical protein
MASILVASCPDVSLFVAFLKRDPRRESQFFKQWHKPLKLAAYQHLKGFSADLAGDVVSETWVLLLEKGPQEFNPARGTVKDYLHLKLCQAAQIVRDDYTDGPLMPPKQGKQRSHRRIPARRLDAPADSSAGSITLVETLVDKEFAYGTVEDRALIQHVAETTSSYQVGHALTRVYERGETPSAAAKVIGMDHTTLGRKLKGYAQKNDENGPKSRCTPTATKGRGNGH